MQLSRRNFVRSAAASTLVASAPLSLTFAATAGSGSAGDILVMISLRGGMDGLNFLAPADDADYVTSRIAGLRLDQGLPISGGPTNQDWRLHRLAAPMKELYDNGQLAFIHAAGLMADTRSHFQAIDLLERGIVDPALIGTAHGWLTRHLATREDGSFGAVAASSLAPDTLLGDVAALSIPDVSDFALYEPALFGFLQQAYVQPDMVSAAGQTTLQSLSNFNVRLQARKATHPETDPTATSYDPDEFTQGLDVVTQLVRMEIGLSVATIEFENWDTHVQQQGQFERNVTRLATGLATFWNNLSPWHDRLTVVILSEFGRRLESNADAGTDHGHGNVISVLGGNVNGGKVFGRWPGLAREQLDLGDLAVVTDVRQVLSEILVLRRNETALDTVFPRFTPGLPLGFVRASGKA